ncbi:hypothetical protein D9M68_892950 [compost metagenome]
MPLLKAYPDIRLEFDINYGFRDIVADHFDRSCVVAKQWTRTLSPSLLTPNYA